MPDADYAIRETDLQLRDGELDARIEEDKRQYVETSCRILKARIEGVRLLPHALTSEEEISLRDAVESVIEANRLLYGRH